MCGTVYYAAQVVVTLKSLDVALVCDHLKKSF